jgi:hypothetical protein
VFLASDHGSCPVNWRLVLPPAWDSDRGLRDTARLPDSERSRPIWQYVLDAIDEMATNWGIPPAPVITDIHLGKYAGPLMNGLESLGMPYAIQVAGSELAMVTNSSPSGRRAISFADVITDALKGSAPALSIWQLPAIRPGKSPFIMTSLPGERPGLALLPPQGPAGLVPAQYQPRPCQHPQRFVAAEWSSARRAARSTWLTTLDPLRKPGIADLGAQNDQVNADLADLYANTGLRHFEGRSFLGWHHYVTLVSVACGWLHLYSLPGDADLALA